MWNITFTKLFNIFIKPQKIQIYKHWRSNAITFKINSMHTDAVDRDISLEDEEKILQVINNSKSKDLMQYSITMKRAENLESHRVKNGSYNSLEDLLQVKGISNKCLYKFYESIIHGNKGKVSKNCNIGMIMTPKVINNNQKEVNTVLGIYVGQNMISWSLLNRDCQVLQWDYKPFPEDKSMNNLHSLLQVTLPIAKLLPKAERYIMQDDCDMVFRGKYQSYRSHVQQSIITTSILSYLSWDHKLDDIEEFVANNIFMLRHHIVRKFYGLLIDKEVISTQYVLQKLLQESDKLMKTKERLPSVLIGTEFKNMYETQSPVYQEQISWSLLIALAFLELIVHQRTDLIGHNINL